MSYMIFGRVVNLIPSDKHPIQLGVAKIDKTI